MIESLGYLSILQDSSSFFRVMRDVPAVLNNGSKSSVNFKDWLNLFRIQKGPECVANALASTSLQKRTDRRPIPFSDRRFDNGANPRSLP